MTDKPVSFQPERMKKIWGDTSCIVKHPTFSVHHIKVMPETWCSVHKHTHRVNSFYVLRGRLTVRSWIHETPHDVVLNAGESLDVPPGMFHQFRSDIGAEVLEVYFPILPDDDDITRITEGGRNWSRPEDAGT